MYYSQTMSNIFCTHGLASELILFLCPAVAKPLHFAMEVEELRGPNAASASFPVDLAGNGTVADAGSVASESSMFRALGLDVCDAADVENLVVDTCDAKLQQIELAKCAKSRKDPHLDALEALDARSDVMQTTGNEVPEQSAGWGRLSAQNLTFDLDDGKESECGDMNEAGSAGSKELQN